MRRMDFGTTSNGIPIHVFHLESDVGVSVSVMEYGATVVSIETPDREGRPGPIVPGFGDLAPYLESASRQSAVLGRDAGRVRGGGSLPGTEPLAADRHKGPYKLHKNASGLHRMVWWGEALGDGVRFHYTSPEGEEGYRGKLDFLVEYRLDSGGCLQVSHRATTNATTHVNLTSQIRLNLRDGGRSSIFDHELSIAADEVLEADREGVPTGHFLPVAGSMLDFRSPRTIGSGAVESERRRGDFDDCYVLRRSTTPIRPVARVRDPGSGRNVELATSQPGLRVDTGVNHGAGQDLDRFSLCLSAQNYPGAAHHRHFPTPQLAPGDIYEQTTVYRFWNEN
jgi:aldose 1-epimerase